MSRMFAAMRRKSRVIFDTVDLHFLREDREAALTGDSGLRHSATVKRQLEHELRSTRLTRPGWLARSKRTSSKPRAPR